MISRPTAINQFMHQVNFFLLVNILTFVEKMSADSFIVLKLLHSTSAHIHEEKDFNRLDFS